MKITQALASIVVKGSPPCKIQFAESPAPASSTGHTQQDRMSCRSTFILIEEIGIDLGDDEAHIPPKEQGSGKW
ncbi:unnamed protein product [Cyprideis torosa]|uniref:Uncharacterized protein n=1 Tax=Cyprideis torosa TaxID=163714 RepID=A0A7R8WI91_9CRUS|nr:unnamed protein product [Cyprideis torosa]CAG0898490.1 unnamed protein product [Cyprideis torosa]